MILALTVRGAFFDLFMRRMVRFIDTEVRLYKRTKGKTTKHRIESTGSKVQDRKYSPKQLLMPRHFH